MISKFLVAIFAILINSGSQAQSIDMVRVSTSTLKDFAFTDKGTCHPQSCFWSEYDKREICPSVTKTKAKVLITMETRAITLEFHAVCFVGDRAISIELQKLKSVMEGDVSVSKRGTCETLVMDIIVDEGGTNSAKDWTWKNIAMKCP